MSQQISELMKNTGAQFGTSGVRGLVDDMTDEVCYAYTAAFLQYLAVENGLQNGSDVGIAGDLRNSTNKIMQAVAATISDMGYSPINCGHIPTPALTLYGIERSIPTIMVTGSHIPEDRNGIKFNKINGEILKQDEQGIRDQSIQVPGGRFLENGSLAEAGVLPVVSRNAYVNYVDRYLAFFPEDCLHGMRLGLYEHSSVASEVLKDVLKGLGAEVVSLGYSEKFVSVDTEAIRQEDVVLAKKWAGEYGFDAIITTDGDGDRPLVSDEQGNWLRGDVAGILCAAYLGANVVVTPVSSNSAVEKCGLFDDVIRTRIGSPYVIEAMLRAAQTDKIVVGYEANGGFLLGKEIERNGKLLKPLLTRDAVIVPLSVIMLAREKAVAVSELLETLPKRFTFSDRLKEFPTELSETILEKMKTSDFEYNCASVRAQFGGVTGLPGSIDSTDGVRITCENGEIIHLRASGNAPELRCYTEADSAERAQELNATCIKIMEQWRG